MEIWEPKGMRWNDFGNHWMWSPVCVLYTIHLYSRLSLWLLKKNIFFPTVKRAASLTFASMTIPYSRKAWRSFHTMNMHQRWNFVNRGRIPDSTQMCCVVVKWRTRKTDLHFSNPVLLQNNAVSNGEAEWKRAAVQRTSQKEQPCDITFKICTEMW